MAQISLVKGILLGGLIGASLSMLDKQTRKNSMYKMRNLKSSFTDFDSMSSSITDTSEKVKLTAEKVSSDVAFIMEKVEELKEVTPTIASIVKETKDAFTSDSIHEEEYKPHGLTSSISSTSSTQYLPQYTH
ncbi:YtxH domain-containing protein [Niallia taxi]|uniref:YtxH domain-containing protein n=1 Tax=Niallia taxi TaxID=2499688 RepID=UPI0011A5373E|nr:YtxH domain-containing protein [Niallia taxi]MCT2343756.1 YtxH domain-containing protein [Niallia taxi]MDE5055540.1 YtxH domain-containing protein [Niallia taxi]MED3965385.1 YtxH domain-containing protein [Niallia taxi]WOD62791.1 YtxH domain-containing protein [Niallia taxi]